MNTDYTVDYEEIDDYLKLFQDSVKTNTTIVTQDELKQPLYHVSVKRQTELVPNVSRRSGLAEDNTIARVHTAPTLMQALKGYGALKNQTINRIPYDRQVKESSKDYKGGLYIHAIDFRLALKPNKKLVYDCDITDETWLVGYNEMLKSYPAKIVGKLFVYEVVYIPKTGCLPLEKISYMVEINDPSGCWLSPKKFIPKGCWKIIDHPIGQIEIIPVDNKEYYEYKTYSASLLNYEEAKKNIHASGLYYLNW